jgi:3-phenylpropionate/trans-cinnamate dioxygenase ferredoxin component
VSTGIRVAALDDIPVGGGISIGNDITGTDDDIALLRDTDGSVWALNDTCTHAMAFLSEGFVGGGVVECPLHGSAFCLKDGHVDGLPATVDTVPHRVEVRDGEVYLFPGVRPESDQHSPGERP